MDSKKERTIAYGLLCLLLVVGIFCYAAFPASTSDEPVRIFLKATSGNVLFDHKEHSWEDGYGIDCVDCHHMWEEGGEKPEACGECHEVDGEDPIKRADAFHQQCMGCHEEDGTAPIDCSGCHAY